MSSFLQDLEGRPLHLPSHLDRFVDDEVQKAQVQISAALNGPPSVEVATQIRRQNVFGKVMSSIQRAYDGIKVVLGYKLNSKDLPKHDQ